MTTPNTLLAAANLIYPPGSQYKPVLENWRVLLKDTRPTISPGLEFPTLVFSLGNKAWAYEIEDALMDDENGGWIFNKRVAGEVEVFPVYRARSRITHRLVSDKNRTTLLLKCVETLEAMKCT